MTLSLAPRWRAILSRAWSIKFIVAAAVFSGLEVAFSIVTPDLLGLPQGTFAALAAVASAGAFAARLVAQKGITAKEDGS
jgi:hypothetical protein